MRDFVIADVTIFDGDDSVFPDGSVLVHDGKIAKVSDTTIKHDGRTISKPGHWLLPGFIDVHIHADGGNPVALPEALRFGVTTVCDMHNEPANIEKLYQQMKGGGCADLKTAGFAATVDMGWPIPVVMAARKDDEKTLAVISTWPKLQNAEEGRGYVQDRLRDGVDYIKLMHESGSNHGAEFNMPSSDLQRAIVDEAHKSGLKVVAHATCLKDTLEILEAGVDGLTHIFSDQPPNEVALMQLLLLLAPHGD